MSSPTHPLRQLDLARLAGVSLRLSRGFVTLEIPRSDVDYAVLHLANEAARARGVEIQAFEIDFTQDSPSSLRFEARVTAHKVLTARVRIAGRLVVNDMLEALVTDLVAKGDGMLGDIAALAVQPELEKYADQRVPLTLPAGFPLRFDDVRLEAGPPLRIVAAVSPV